MPNKNIDYIKGAKNLHYRIGYSYTKAITMALNYLETDTKIKDNAIKELSGRHSFKIYVDFGSQKNLSSITGYFIFFDVICRFIKISFDTALLFPLNYKGSNAGISTSGLSVGEIINLINQKKSGTLIFTQKERNYNYPNTVGDYNPLFDIQFIEGKPQNLKDDIGEKVDDFNDVEFLDEMSPLIVPYQTNKYTLVDVEKFSPYSKLDNGYCLLFAEFENENDEHSIKVYRWFAQERKESLKSKKYFDEIRYQEYRYERGREKSADIYTEITGVNKKASQKGIDIYREKKKNYLDQLNHECVVGDVFFNLGYISPMQSAELYDLMVNENNRLLFGRIENDKISIIGGREIFFNTDFKFPKALYNISLL